MKKAAMTEPNMLLLQASSCHGDCLKQWLADQRYFIIRRMWFDLILSLCSGPHFFNNCITGKTENKRYLG